MDEYTGQRTAGGLAISRRGSGISFRDSTDESRNIQNCNRLRCGTRLNSVKGINTSNPEKGKYSKPSFRSLSSKTSVGSSTKSFAGMSDHRKLNQEQRKPASLTVIAESSSKQVLEDAKLVPSTSGIQIKPIEPEDVETAVSHSLSMNRTDKEVINTRPQKQMQQSGLVNKNTATGSSVRRSLSSRISSQAGKSTSQNQGASTPRYGLRNLGCSSINDVLSSGSSTDSSGRRINMIKKRCPDGESSSSRSKKIGGSSSGLGSQGNALSSQSLSPADISTPQPTSRRTRNWSLGSSSDAPVRARRVISGDTVTRLSTSDGDNGFSISRHMVIPQLPETEISINETTLGRSSESTLTEQPSICLNSFRQSGPINGTVRSRPITRPEDSSTHPFHRLSLERDGFRHFNMEGIAEVLLALERIEHDEELTYEQLLVLESNLFLGGPGFHDQHRDMRLDIDNMSYEELLALEEKMGTVSTALTEEELSNCLKRSCYMPALMIEGITGCGDDDTKCSICQKHLNHYHDLCCGYMANGIYVLTWIQWKSMWWEMRWENWDVITVIMWNASLSGYNRKTGVRSAKYRHWCPKPSASEPYLFCTILYVVVAVLL